MEYIKKILKDDILTQAAALGFYVALAISPLVVLLITFLPSIDQRWHERLLLETQDLMGPDASRVVESIIHRSATLNLHQANVWSVLVLVVSVSAVFTQLQNSLNHIFESPILKKNTTGFLAQVKSFVSKRLVCFGMVLTFLVISIVSLIISGLLRTSFVGNAGTDVRILHAIGDFLVYSILFGVIFKWMPDREVRAKAAFQGGVLTALLFSVGKFVIGLYMSRTAFASAYGIAGSLIVLLLWVYYSATIFLTGAEISALLHRRKNGPSTAARPQ